MSAAVIPSKISFQQIVKYPVTWLLIVVCLAIGVVFNKFVALGQENKDDCDKRVTYLEQKLTESETRERNLTTALLIKNGVINEVKKATDSVVREKIGNEAKKIVE